MKTNRIEKTVTEDDRLDNKIDRMSAKSLAEEILEKLESGAPYSTTFVEAIPQAHKEEAEEELKRRFEHWANSWVAPLARRIIAKG